MRLPYETHGCLSWVKVDPEQFLDADDCGHEHRAWHGALCENDGMRTEILPPDFLTRFAFLFLGKFDFSNRLIKRKHHDSLLPGYRRYHLRPFHRRFIKFWHARTRRALHLTGDNPHMRAYKWLKM